MTLVSAYEDTQLNLGDKFTIFYWVIVFAVMSFSISPFFIIINWRGIVVIFSLIIFFQNNYVKRAINSLKWIKTKAVVTNSKIKKRSGDSGTSYLLILKGNYNFPTGSVNEFKYKEKVHLNSNDAAEKYADQLKLEGREVFVNPEKPEQNRKYQWLTKSDYNKFLGSFGLYLGSLMFIFFYHGASLVEEPIFDNPILFLVLIIILAILSYYYRLYRRLKHLIPMNKFSNDTPLVYHPLSHLITTTKPVQIPSSYEPLKYSLSPYSPTIFSYFKKNWFFLSFPFLVLNLTIFLMGAGGIIYYFIFGLIYLFWIKFFVEWAQSRNVNAWPTTNARITAIQEMDDIIIIDYNYIYDNLKFNKSERIEKPSEKKKNMIHSDYRQGGSTLVFYNPKKKILPNPQGIGSPIPNSRLFSTPLGRKNMLIFSFVLLLITSPVALIMYSKYNNNGMGIFNRSYFISLGISLIIFGLFHIVPYLQYSLGILQESHIISNEEINRKALPIDYLDVYRSETESKFRVTSYNHKLIIASLFFFVGIGVILWSWLG